MASGHAITCRFPIRGSAGNRTSPQVFRAKSAADDSAGARGEGSLMHIAGSPVCCLPNLPLHNLREICKGKNPNGLSEAPALPPASARFGPATRP